MGVMVYSLPWVMQDLCHQRYQQQEPSKYQPPKVYLFGYDSCVNAAAGRLHGSLEARDTQRC